MTFSQLFVERKQEIKTIFSQTKQTLGYVASPRNRKMWRREGGNVTQKLGSLIEYTINFINDHIPRLECILEVLFLKPEEPFREVFHCKKSYCRLAFFNIRS